MKTFHELLRLEQAGQPACSEPQASFVDPRDPDLDIWPAPSYCISLGQQIRRSREGLENSFMSDIVDYDKDPNALDPYADIRSTLDERQAYVDRLNREKKERHEASLAENKGSVSTNGDPTVEAPVIQPTTPTE